MTAPTFAFGAGTAARVYLLFGPELVLEWATSYAGATAHFHYRADVYGEGDPRPCHLRGIESCWPSSGSLMGGALAVFESADLPLIEAAMRADYEPAAAQVRAVLAAGAR